jgi:hypothetical protein
MSNCVTCKKVFSWLDKSNKLLGTGVLKDGGQVCSTCWSEIFKKHNDIDFKQFNSHEIELIYLDQISPSEILDNRKKEAAKNYDDNQVDQTIEKPESVSSQSKEANDEEQNKTTPSAINDDEKIDEEHHQEKTKIAANHPRNLLKKVMSYFSRKYLEYRERDLVGKFAFLNFALIYLGVVIFFVVTGTVSFYALIVFAVGILTSCICPCIGLGMSASAVAIWFQLLQFYYTVAFILLSIVSILSVCGLVVSAFDRKVRNKTVMLYLAFQLIFAIGFGSILYPIVNPMAYFFPGLREAIDNNQNAEMDSEIDLNAAETFVGKYYGLDEIGGSYFKVSLEILSVTSYKTRHDEISSDYEYFSMRVNSTKNEIITEGGERLVPEGNKLKYFSNGRLRYTLSKL